MDGLTCQGSAKQKCGPPFLCINWVVVVWLNIAAHKNSTHFTKTVNILKCWPKEWQLKQAGLVLIDIKLLMQICTPPKHQKKKVCKYEANSEFLVEIDDHWPQLVSGSDVHYFSYRVFCQIADWNFGSDAVASVFIVSVLVITRISNNLYQHWVI